MAADKPTDEPPGMAERCRICLFDHGCMTSLLNDRVETQLKDLTKCTSIDIKYEENLPGVVCHRCLYKLSLWNEFKEMFIQSNKALLEQLEISEVSDNDIKDSSKDGDMGQDVRKKRKDDKSNLCNLDKKKSRLDVSSAEVTNVTCGTGQGVIDVMSSTDDLPKGNAKVGKQQDAESKMSYSGSMRARLLPARRGRNIERRKASTKRWVARKRALLAATGEIVSDTDSIASDEMQLSPVQKARAKTNADKEAEKQKKIAKVLKNLETNLTEKYKVAFRDKDTDSDTRRTRYSKEPSSNVSKQRNKNSLLSSVGTKSIKQRNISSDSLIERDNSLTDNVMLEVCANKSKVQADEQAFTPQSLKSELVVGDVTFAVTSTLILVDPRNLDNVDINNLTKDSKNSSLDESNQEKNTDIIDAVQLRRVNPVTPNTRSKSKSKLVERCLNIEVEGNELEVLKRVQHELADFVEKDMKQKLLGTDDSVAKIDKANSAKSEGDYLRQKLDQKLKDIIEFSIKKNIESSMIGQMGNSQGFTRFSSTLANIAVNSPKYQPKVVVKRLDMAKESKHYNVNNAHALKLKSKRIGPFSMITRKRQIIPPVRYNDYNITALSSDSDGDAAETLTTLKPINMKTPNVTRRQSATIIGKPVEKRQADGEEAKKIEDPVTENHICGVCGLTFHARSDVEAHVRTHKTPVVQVVLQNDHASPSPKPRQAGKQKVMRCKRCHEIVEARLVKTHVCKFHKCYVCNSIFRTKNILAKHLESHDHSEFNIINAIGNKKLNNADALLKILSAASVSPQKDQETEAETATAAATATATAAATAAATATVTATAIATATGTKTQALANEKNDIQSDKISSTGMKLDNAETIKRKPEETYTCFVCDKIFTDKEVLKDHLQMHCDDLSEGEQSNSKDQYQCAICGSTLESDQALEDHVGKHLFDDEDDNPNLISINQSSESYTDTRETEYQCGQCSEMFDSEVLLEMHMQAHEEEFAIAEWEEQGMKVQQYQCMLCDELFNAEEELAEHLDIHNANAQVCQLCDKPFRTLEDLQKHVATH